VPKINGYPWSNATATYYTDLPNVIAITGQPIFTAFDAAGNSVTLPVVLGAGTAVTAASQSTLKSIKTIKVSVAVQAIGRDADTNQAIQVAMTGSARVNQ
jgi:hypothetical protein